MKYLEKFLQQFLKDEKGVTPVVGVILMVAVTVVMGAVIAGFVYGYVGSTEQGPLLGLSIGDAPANDNAIILKHTGGETMAEGDWKLSVTAGKDAATDFEFGTAASDSNSIWPGTIMGNVDAELSAGKTLTIGFQTSTDNQSELAPGWFHVVIIHEPSSSLLMDTNVQVR